MNTPQPTLPIDIYVNKKNVGTKILIFVLGSLFLAAFTWFAIQYFEDGDPFADFRVFFFPLAAIVCAICAVGQIILYNRKSPLVTLTRGNIQVFEKALDPIGPVSWQDITGFREMAISQSVRKMIFYGKNTSVYADRILNDGQRKRYLKASQHHHNGLLWVNMSLLDYHPVEFKELIQGMLITNQVNN